ncbi:MAG: TatD family hydrolase [Verrucomicrobiota bacterium]|nr:TatD family hydrolase [Verrucomicrobiota bacterium]
MLIDTHAHLDFPEFANDLDELQERAAAAGVDRIITIGTSIEGSRRAVALADRYANVFAVVGVHPSNAAEAPDDVITPLREIARHRKVVAIGETGLDYHRVPSLRIQENDPALSALGNESPADIDAALADGAYKARQASVFEQQLELAAELGFNAVIHEREAWEDTVATLQPHMGRVRGVFHCFAKAREQAEQILALGHLVSFTGIITFKNAGLVQDTAARVANGRFMVETDCPYLAPDPHRGRRCEPAHARLVAEKIAELRGTTLEEIARETTATAEGFFRFPH